MKPEENQQEEPQTNQGQEKTVLPDPQKPPKDKE